MSSSMEPFENVQMPILDSTTHLNVRFRTAINGYASFGKGMSIVLSIYDLSLIHI